MKDIELLFTGDFCPIGRIQNVITSKNNTDGIYNDFAELLNNVDFSVTNLECPLCDDNIAPIEKIGPALRASKQSVELLKKGNFSLVTLANNHILDYGIQGLKSTIDCCYENGIQTVGGGLNQCESRKTYYQTINGLKIGFYNIAENEFSTIESSSYGANSLNLINNYYDIIDSKNKCDFLFVVVHGGIEGYNLPSPWIQNTYRFFIDIGASAVIGHHTHCFSGYELYNNKPIFYSLGNFIFDSKGSQLDALWTTGYAVKILISDYKITFTLHPYVQNDKKTIGVRKLTECEYSEFKEKIDELNHVIIDANLIKKKYNELSKSREKNYLTYIEPFTCNKYYNFLFYKGLIFSFYGKSKRLLLLNLLRCESHRDLLIKILKR